MSDGITESRRGTYFLDRSETQEEREKRYHEILEKNRLKRVSIVEMIKAEQDIDKAQKILLDFLQNPRAEI